MADEDQTETETEEESSELGLTTDDGETTDKGVTTDESKTANKTDRSSETDKQAEQTCAAAAKVFCKVCTFCLKIYNDKYKRQIVVASCIFLLALKLANECHAILIPPKQYTPFKR